MSEIDFVIAWVDGNDPEWQREKAKYKGIDLSDVRDSRYRDWETLKYLFRGIEKFAPWVHSVLFVTCGQKPQWLNTNSEKLRLVDHKDYIPDKYLPTFSSRTIDMNYHRIKDLSEKFVYFNDDMFLVKPVTEEDFFRNDLPCETAILDAKSLAGKDRNGVPYELSNLYTAVLFNMVPINRHFNKKNSIRQNLSKWYNYRYGAEQIRTLLLSQWELFTGFKSAHVPYSYLKSTYTEVWDKEEELLDTACSHKFREVTDVNHWVFNYWQIASGRFFPRSPKCGYFDYMTDDEERNKAVANRIKSGKSKFVCINDEVTNPVMFDAAKKILIHTLNDILPEKSSFEL